MIPTCNDRAVPLLHRGNPGVSGGNLVIMAGARRDDGHVLAMHEESGVRCAKFANAGVVGAMLPELLTPRTR
jgi:hypothetical protein